MADLAIDPSNDVVVYAASAFSLFKSTDGGTNWVELPHDMGTYPRVDVTFDPSDASRLYVTSMAGGVFRSTNGGASFTRISALPTDGNVDGPRVFAISADGNALYYGTNGNLFFRSTDGGASFNTLRGGLPVMPVGGGYAPVQHPIVVVTKGFCVRQRIAAIGSVVERHHPDVIHTIIPIGLGIRRVAMLGVVGHQFHHGQHFAFRGKICSSRPGSRRIREGSGCHKPKGQRSEQHCSHHNRCSHLARFGGRA